MGWYGNGADDGMWALTAVFWVVLVMSMFWMMIRAMPWREKASGGSAVTERSNPVEILDQRFARGELDEETYRTQRELLIKVRD